MNTDEMNEMRVITISSKTYLGYVNTKGKTTTVSKAMKCNNGVSSGDMAKYLEVEVNGKYDEVNFVGDIQFINRPLTEEEKEQFEIHMITMKRAIRDREAHYTVELYRAYRGQ